HLSTDSKARWNFVSAIFAIVVVEIVVAGTMWIMIDLYDMMM
ncbi:cytochrome o ubiquinol oxidase subunit IV, partial [Francisella tularensis subsp. holarctica]|nr:cytochrome o ubiquinol oxidase subunit IV [Francisella tularensis subsp. holarctica]